MRPAPLAGLLGLIAAYLLATTYPFERYSNEVSFRGGVAVFERPGLLQTVRPPGWLSEAISGNELTIELSVESMLPGQTGPARIFTVSKDHQHSNITIGQDGPDLILRLRRSSEVPLGTPPYVVPAVFHDSRTRDIRVSIQRNTLGLWVDGVVRIQEALPVQALTHWDSGYLLGLGNELTWQRPWQGRIFAARVTTTSGTVNVLSPAIVKVSGIRELARRRLALVRWNPLDALLNLLALVPLGALTGRCLSRPRSATVFLIWLPVCLTAEFLQISIIGRFPSIPDAVLNVIGAWIGAAIYSAWSRRRHKANM